MLKRARRRGSCRMPRRPGNVAGRSGRSSHPARLTVAWATAISTHVALARTVAWTRNLEGARRLVRLPAPAAVTGDAGLPGLLRGDAAATGDRLRIVAADVAHNLDMQQEDVNLADPAVTVRPGDDRASIE